MPNTRGRQFMAAAILLLGLLLGGWACSILGRQPSELVEGLDAVEEEGGREPAAATQGAQYRGLGLDSLPAYAATFEATFTAADEPPLVWTYHVETLASDVPPGLRRSLSIEGVEGDMDLGDVTLILLDDTQYMTGRAVGAAGCLTFPASVDLEDSFLTPDDFLTPPTLSGVLTPDGSETVAGQAGKRYAFEADSLGDFTDASGQLVLAEDGGYVLRYDLTAQTVDTRFTDGRSGQLTWRFEITDLAPDETVAVPEGCEIDYPIMDDAYDVARLPDIVIYKSPSSAEEVAAYYEEALPAEGWGLYSFPTTRDGATVMVYARDGEFMSISVAPADGGSEVQILVEKP